MFIQLSFCSITYYVPRSSLYLSNCCEHRTLDLAASHRRTKCQRCQSWPPHRRCPQCAVLPFGRRPAELDKRSQQYFTVVPRCLTLLSQGCLVVWKLNTVTVWIICLNDISDIIINKKNRIVWKFRVSGLIREAKCEANALQPVLFVCVCVGVSFNLQVLNAVLIILTPSHRLNAMSLRHCSAASAANAGALHHNVARSTRN